MFAGEVIATVGARLFTLTETAVAVVELPDLSVATAVNVCEPLVAVVESQTRLNGDAVSAEPRFAPSNLNCTLAIPLVDEALAETVTLEPDTLVPLPGAVMFTVGGVTCWLLLP